MIPFLLDPVALGGAGQRRLRGECLECIGQQLLTQWPDLQVINETCGAVKQDAQTEWWKAFGLEFLWGQWMENGVSRECPSDLKGIIPFEGIELTVGELWDAEGAVVLIPIRTAKGEGSVMQMWLVRVSARKGIQACGKVTRDHRQVIRGLESWLQETGRSGLSVFLRSPEWDFSTGGVVGKSWMLGVSLALRALENGDCETLRLLASDWIVTGELEASGRVLPVGMDGKINLILSRRWLIPSANEPDLTPRFRTRYAGRIGLVVDQETAWRHLTGKGTQRELPSEKWPRGEQVEALHGLVSPAVKPLIASILYTLPQKVFLWHSEETKKQADLIQGVVDVLKERGVLPADFEATPLLIDSGDLVKAEGDLRSHSTIAQVTDRLILFNITGGNMLMKYAVINLAALNPGVWLLYRDVSNKSSHDFVRLRTLGTQFGISPLRGDESGEIQWPFLFEVSRDDSVESLVDGIFGEVPR